MASGDNSGSWGALIINWIGVLNKWKGKFRKRLMERFKLGIGFRNN